MANLFYRMAKRAMRMQVPCVPAVHRPLYQARLLVLHAVHEARRMLWWTPIFQSRLVRPARGLHVYSGIPQVLGSFQIEFGDNCAISGLTTLTGRTAGRETPRLTVGSNTDIGWGTTIAVGRRVEIGKDVLIAGCCFLAGYPGHPLDPDARAARLPDTEDQVGDIVLEDGVWLATNVAVMAGVRIGKGSVVTAGSVVFRNIPPGVIATGVPARVVGPVLPGAVKE